MAPEPLAALMYPRHLHKGDGEYLSVCTPEACERALAEGWHLEPWNHWTRCADSPAPDGVERPSLADVPPPDDTDPRDRPDAPAEEDIPAPDITPEPVTRKPGRPKKAGA